MTEKRFPYAGAIDADGHVLEPPDLWMKYVDPRLRELPSVYFHRQCWISGDPDEKAFVHVIEFVGADRFFWASDFPHPDHPGNYMEELAELVAPLSESARRKVLGENVTLAYGL